MTNYSRMRCSSCSPISSRFGLARRFRWLFALGLICHLSFVIRHSSLAGPPYVTDDPDPVEFQHWEVYVASLPIHTMSSWSGSLPQLEINYGAAPNLQLHAIMPEGFEAPHHGGPQFSYGDTELGFKYRFVKDTESTPEIGIFPLVEVPSGNASRGYGAGRTETYFPLWIQKTIGKWTTYGGGGYWFNPGPGHQNFGYVGALLQRQMTKTLSLGVEAFHTTSQGSASSSASFLYASPADNTVANAGGVWDLSEHHHILFSAGHTVQGPSSFICYAAFQYTFGPEHEEAGKDKGNEK
jgi:hypothetical protein